jgi:hypothetical protein
MNNEKTVHHSYFSGWAMLFYVGGIVIAQGFWSVFFAVIFPPYSYYLLAEQLIKHFLP